MKKRESSLTVDGNVNWYRHYTVQRFHKSLKLKNRVAISPSNLIAGYTQIKLQLEKIHAPYGP